MRREYPKLRDIDEDIWAYQAKLRSLKAGTKNHTEVRELLLGLKVKRKANRYIIKWI